MATDESDALLTTSRVARALGLSEPMVRKLASDGTIPSIRTATGVRLYRPVDVEHVRASRARRREAGEW